VRGLVTWNGDATLGDFVIMRSNGMPVYNFCVAVDDYLMNISHVIRAEEHLSNTPKQLLVLEALGCTTPPTYAHCSLILAQDRSKLSKRHGATSVNEFKSQSFSSNSMINYLCNLGWNSGLKKEIFLPQELINLFDMSRIIPSSAVFDMRKLRWVNAQHLHLLPPEDYLETILASLRRPSGGDSKPLLKYHLSAKADGNDAGSGLPAYPGSEERRQSFCNALLNILRKDMQVSNDACDLLREYVSYPLFDTITGKDTRPLEIVEDYHEQFLQIARIVVRDYEAMRSGNVSSDKVPFPVGNEEDIEGHWKQYVAQVSEEMNAASLAGVPIKNNVIMMSLRLLLTGRSKGPSVGQQIALVHFAEEFLTAENESYSLVPIDARMRKIKELLLETSNAIGK
jgi:glutamyl-tRNA synthetase